MDTSTLQIAQAYLTTEDRVIVDLESLFNRHPDDKVISFLEFYLKEKKEEIKDFVILGVINNFFDQAVTEWFRLQLAINTLKQGVAYAQSGTKQRTAKGI